MDDLYRKKTIAIDKNLKNKYYSKKEKKKVAMDFISKELAKKAKPYKYYIIDIVESNSPFYITKYLPKDIKKVLVYSGLNKLVSNIIKRKNYDPRHRSVFTQFAKYYIKTNKKK